MAEPRQEYSLAYRPSPDTIAQVQRTCNDIQSVLELNHGLQSFRLQKVSSFIWPIVTSREVELTRATRGANYTFWSYKNDLDTSSSRWDPRPSIMRLRFTHGLLPFSALQPVVHLGAETLESVAAATQEQLVTSGKRVSFLNAVEGVSRFLHAQVQFDHFSGSAIDQNRFRFVGSITADMVGQVDTLVALGHYVKQATGLPLTDPRNDLGQEVLLDFIKDETRREGMRLSPFYTSKSKGNRAVKGFMEYLVSLSRIGDDEYRTVLLHQFYTASSADKMRFLDQLYQRVAVEEGRVEYEEYAQWIQSIFRNEYEFHDTKARQEFKMGF